MTVEKYYTLANGQKIPSIGFGTWQVEDGEVAENSVKAAIEAGYRHIDTAAIYGNEVSVGRGIKASEIAREELFITTKLWNDKHSYEGAKQALDESLTKLGLDYLDLYLIHWPAPAATRDTWAEDNAQTWRAMEETVQAGKIRSIGVSNFMPHHLDELFKTAQIKPVVNQIFLNPSDQQESLVAYNKEHHLLSEAYSPLGRGQIFQIEAAKTVAAKYGKSVSQVVLRWSLQKGFLPLPKSVHKERIIENLAVYDFSLSDEDMLVLDGLKGLAGQAPDPDTKPF